MNHQRVLDGKKVTHLDAEALRASTRPRGYFHPNPILDGETPASQWAEALEAAPGGRNTSAPDQTLESLEFRKTRIQNEKVYLIDPRPLTVPPVAFHHFPELGHYAENVQRVGQSRRGSLLESLVNILVVASINYTANLLIFPLFGWHLSAHDNVLMVVIYTGISVVRSYGLRRLFNRRAVKK